MAKTRSLEIRSLIDASHTVTIDPYAANPIADDVRALTPEVYAIATRDSGPPPKMFGNGSRDLPIFTASGIDPRALMDLPYTQRHHVAALESRAQVLGIFEQHADDPDTRFDHEGLTEAITRVYNWASGRSKIK